MLSCVERNIIKNKQDIKKQTYLICIKKSKITVKIIKCKLK